MSGTNDLMLVTTYGFMFPPSGLDDSPIMLKKKKSDQKQHKNGMMESVAKQGRHSGCRCIGKKIR